MKLLTSMLKKKKKSKIVQQVLRWRINFFYDFGVHLTIRFILKICNLKEKFSNLHISILVVIIIWYNFFFHIWEKLHLFLKYRILLVFTKNIIQMLLMTLIFPTSFILSLSWFTQRQLSLFYIVCRNNGFKTISRFFKYIKVYV